MTDNLRRDERLKRPGIRIVPVNVGAGSRKKDAQVNPKYTNIWAEVGFTLLEKHFVPGHLSLSEEARAGPTLGGGVRWTSMRESPMEEQATDLRYGFGRGGKVLQPEDNEGLKARHGGKSPDELDATMLAFMDGPPVAAGAAGEEEMPYKGLFSPFV